MKLICVNLKTHSGNRQKSKFAYANFLKKVSRGYLQVIFSHLKNAKKTGITKPLDKAVPKNRIQIGLSNLSKHLGEPKASKKGGKMNQFAKFCKTLLPTT